MLRTQVELGKIERDTLRELDRLKSLFFANISHEFRTPLTLILGQVESVMASVSDTRDKEKLAVANQNAKRLLLLINQLLDLSKVESGNMELRTTQHNLVSFLQRLFFSLESLADSKKITFRFLPERDNIQAVFDPEKIEKVFFNLISNAIKFTNNNGEIVVSVKTVGLKYVEIYVRDNGIGIPENQLTNIFSRFFQVDNLEHSNFEGTGIGLSLVKELVELHHGEVVAKSAVGAGSTFVVKLPVGELNEENKDEVVAQISDFSSLIIRHTEIDQIEIDDDESVQEKEIVLIVEDHKEVRAFIRDQLENDYQVKEAENGKTGMIAALKIIPDLIVTDLMMPKVNGFQFCNEVRNDARTSHIPIIMLTAKAGFDDKMEALETGIDDYIIKPFHPQELKLRVRNLINQRKLLRSRFKIATVIKPSEVTMVSVDQQFLEKTIHTIEKNIDNQNFSVESLAEAVNMSVSQLNRKLNALIEQPAGQLMRSLRLQRAADLLKKNAGSIAEICYQLDFNDPAYFSRAFKKQFGCSPSAFIKS